MQHAGRKVSESKLNLKFTELRCLLGLRALGIRAVCFGVLQDREAFIA
jgi:hypothetical protein